MADHDDLYAPPRARKRQRPAPEPQGRVLRSTKTLAILALAFIGGQVGLHWLVHFVDLISLSDIEQHQVSPGLVSFERVLDGLATCSRLTGIVLFLIWIYRAAANAKDLNPGTTDVNPGWAVASYFIPVGMLWLPYTSMAAIVRRSDPNSNGITPPIVIGWWLTYLGSNLAFTLRTLFDDVGSRIVFMLFVTAGLTLALVLLALIMRRIEQGQAILAKVPIEVAAPSLPGIASPPLA